MEGQNPYQPPGTIAAGPVPATGLGPSGYEFDGDENLVIAKTAKLARLWGVFALIVGGLLLVALGIGIVVAVDLANALGVDPRIVLGVAGGLLPLVIVDLVVGGIYISAGGSLRAVVDTSGGDVPHLMQGVGRLANAFQIEAIVTVVALVGGFVFGLWLAANTGGTTWTL